MKTTILGAGLAGLIAFSVPTLAHACACCANTGQRYVATAPLTKERAAIFAKVKFAPEAELLTGDTDLDQIKGIETPSADYILNVTRHNNVWTFNFKDSKGKSGALSFAQPKTASFFEVDTRDAPTLKARRFTRSGS